MTPKGQLWNNRRAWGTAQDIERLQRAASGKHEPGPYAESVKAFRQAIQDRHGDVLVSAGAEVATHG